MAKQATSQIIDLAIIAKKEQIVANNIKSLESIKSDKTTRNKDTILAITTWQSLRKSQRMRKLSKKPNKLNRKRNKQLKRLLIPNRSTKTKMTLISSH